MCRFNPGETMKHTMKLTLISVKGGRRTHAIFAWVRYTDGRAVVDSEWLAEIFDIRRGDGWCVG